MLFFIYIIHFTLNNYLALGDTFDAIGNHNQNLKFCLNALYGTYTLILNALHDFLTQPSSNRKPTNAPNVLNAMAR